MIDDAFGKAGWLHDMRHVRRGADWQDSLLTGATPSCIRATAGHETSDVWSLKVLQRVEAIQCVDAWLRHEGSRLSSQLPWLPQAAVLWLQGWAACSNEVQAGWLLQLAG